MYIATFYSYKGGVGRTMAMANVAYLLASAGKRVLAVDFDLEAPGLSSYGPFRCAGQHPGIVEFVREYVDTNEAPDVGRFIMECRAGDYPIWLMPAGRHTEPGYAASYSSINWQELYSERDGFLLFEDLRQQWAAFDEQGFEYILIDSRTGHTDIGGICTRQLPDAVIILFMPTPQNIDGLRPIVRNIRAEGAPVRREKVTLHFCPSNVPDLDDQELVLERLLNSAKSELRYDRVAAQIHHYGALDLLDESLYALNAPNSRLAKEYETLKNSIIGHNLEDAQGAAIALDRMRAEYLTAIRANEKPAESEIRASAAMLFERFSQDPEVTWRVASLANVMIRPQDEREALDAYLEVSRQNLAPALLRRARAKATLDDQSGAVDDLVRVLTAEQATAFEVAPAAELLKRLKPEAWRSVFADAIRNSHLDSSARALLLQALMLNRDDVAQVLSLVHEALQRGAKRDETLRNSWSIALIADGQFEATKSLIAPSRDFIVASRSMADVFNYAIAEWALTSQPPADLFAQVVALGARSTRQLGPNVLQCLALARYLVSDLREAIEDLKQAQVAARRVTSIFSCWRYLTVTANEMQADLDEMFDLFSRGVPLRPPVRDGLKTSNAV
jgi:MinD-like ATPase involved in chromosome partitioning or flagellar assembly